MSSNDEDVDETTTYVTASLPEWQKQQWEQEAEKINMSLSGYTRTMVEAGRSKIGLDETGTPSEFSTGNLEDQIREAINENGSLTWNNLVETVFQNMEDRIDKTASEMSDVDVKKGEYTLIDQ